MLPYPALWNIFAYRSKRNFRVTAIYLSTDDTKTGKRKPELDLLGTEIKKRVLKVPKRSIKTNSDVI